MTLPPSPGKPGSYPANDEVSIMETSMKEKIQPDLVPRNKVHIVETRQIIRNSVNCEMY
jgi:hypothetical protein